MHLKSLVRACLVASLGWLLLASSVDAAAFSIRPIYFANDLGFSVIATGTITADGVTGQISDWNLAVTTRNRVARFTPGNTANLATVGVASNGSELTVATSPDGIDDGGELFFRSPNPFQDVGALVADFTGANTNGGQAMYMYGGAFDVLPLNAPDGSSYVAARSSGGSLFELVSLPFDNGVTMTGTITTNGAVGQLAASDITSWDIVVDEVTQDLFNPSNSSVSSNLLGVSADGSALTVTKPEGYLAFSKGALGGRPYVLQLADFTEGSFFFGQAVYLQGRLAQYAVTLGAGRGPWEVTGPEPVGVPEPSAMALAAAGLVGLALRKGQRTARRHKSGIVI